MDEEDLHHMEQCHGVVVASAIFGNALFNLKSTFFSMNLVDSLSVISVPIRKF